MRGRRSSRSAAVVLAGCVGLAVFAPGLALAQPVAGVSEAECTPAVGTWDPVAGVCDDGTSSTTTTTTDATGGGTTGSSATSSSGSTGAGTGTAAPTDGGDAAGASAGTPGTETAPGVTGTQPGTAGTAGTANDGTETETGPTGDPATAPVPQAAPISTAALAEGVPQLQAALNEDLLEDLPLADLLPLPDLPDIIPAPDAGGNFENVNDACLNAISQLQFPAGTEGLDVLSEQLQGFCTTLDPTNLTDLLDSLLELLNGLIPSLPTPGNPIPNTPPQYVPADYWGYWHHQYDVDCPELTYDEANQILAWDRSDPFRLDRDNDGEACEANAHGDDVEYVEYIGYPVGGVATGDGSTDSGASGVEVALAAGVLSGLGVTGLALVRRFARQG